MEKLRNFMYYLILVQDISKRSPIPETELSVIPGFAVNFQTNE